MSKIRTTRRNFASAGALGLFGAVATPAAPALAQTDNVTLGMPGSSRAYSVADAIPAKDGVKRLVVLKGLDKITGRAVNIYAPIGIPVKYASLTITAMAERAMSRIPAA